MPVIDGVRDQPPMVGGGVRPSNDQGPANCCQATYHKLELYAAHYLYMQLPPCLLPCCVSSITYEHM